MSPTGWTKAWEDILGADHVVTDPATLDAASTATFPTSARVHGILRPTSREEVQDCLRLANRLRTPLYPVSQGRNWGLGSRVPTRDGCILLDLGRMNRILEYSESLAYVVVQPGVTFRQLYAFLRDHGSGLTAPVTGGPADGSLIGNFADRGEAVGPYGERSSFACGLEVVLPTGDCIHTGFGRFDAATTARLDPWGVGVHLDGLFTQSSLGVVTSATFWLVPKPECLRIFTFAIGDLSRLDATVKALRGPALRGTIRSHCLTVWNGHKVAARNGSMPRSGKADWFGCGALYAESLDQAQAETSLIKRAVDGLVDDLCFYDANEEPAVRDSLFAGVPNDANLRSIYRRKRAAVPSTPDPDRDRCGLLWVCASVPMQGTHAVRASRIMQETLESCDFESNIGMSCVSGRLLHAFAAIVFDRDVAGDDERAMACHAALSGALIAAGYLPYRLGLPAMEALPQPTDGYGKLIKALKHTLDPNDILAPGRYDFRGTWPQE